MTELLILDAIWLALLTVVTLGVARETAVLRNTLHRRDGRRMQGPPLGAAAPRVAGVGVHADDVLLFLAPDCPPCAQVVRTLRPEDAALGLVPVIAGPADDPAVRRMVDAIPHAGTWYAGPVASRLRRVYRVASEPFAIRTEGGIVQAKAFLRHAGDLRRTARPTTASVVAAESSPVPVTIEGS
jgi:hypothetical protein